MNALSAHQKVFGIGLSRTGTTSLSEALNLLGIKTIHFPWDAQTYEDLTRGNYRLTLLEQYQGVVDTTVAPYYAHMDNAYPDIKFILTVREKESWLRSCKAELEHSDWVARQAFLPEQFWKFKEFILAAVYGVHHFQRD